MTRSLPLRPVAAGAVALALLLGGCGDDGSAGPNEGVTLDDVTEEDGLDFDTGEGEPDDADAYVGEEVTVSGEVAARINDTTFHIGDESVDDSLLVFADEAIIPELSSNDIVQVTGTVREVDRDTFETEFGIPWDDEYAGVGSRHAVIATEVEVIGEDEPDPLD